MNDIEKLIRDNLARKFVKRFTSPVEKFMQLEAASGLVLILATIVSLYLANSEYSAAFKHLIHLPLGIQIADFTLIKSFEHWVNDGLMVVFFYFVGLEIKRELMIGELASMKKAALPIFAALGGMIVPALIYAYFNQNLETLKGWGIPMATDIAFAVGVLVLLGKRVPFSLKVFLLALAIVDDLGAVLVIALFYSNEISINALILASALLAAIAFLRAAKVQMQMVYLTLSILTWLAVLQSGVHATVSGVLLGFLTPLVPLIPEGEVGRLVKQFGARFDSNEIPQLKNIFHHAVSPVDNMINMLAPWVSFVLMPVFALVNAGVIVESSSFQEILSHPISLGVVLGLAVGKPLGVAFFAFIATKMKWAELPPGVNMLQILGVGAIAGIGFTMALFIGHLSLPEPHNLDIAKLAVLIASLISAIVGSLILLVGARKSN